MWHVKLNSKSKWNSILGFQSYLNSYIKVNFPKNYKTVGRGCKADTLIHGQYLH